jgi:hypothetical protein
MKLTKSEAAEISLVEEILKNLILKIGYSSVIIALHNACVHGVSIPSISDESLTKMFKHYDALIKIAKSEGL